MVDLTESRGPIPKNDYYTAMGVTEERLRRYSRLEFFTLFASEGHYGPFDKDFFYREISTKDPLSFHSGTQEREEVRKTRNEPKSCCSDSSCQSNNCSET